MDANATQQETLRATRWGGARQFEITTWAGLHDLHGQRHVTTFEGLFHQFAVETNVQRIPLNQLVRKSGDPSKYEKPKWLPGISLATFDGPRSKSSVEQVHALAFDFDGGCALAEAKQNLTRLGWASFLSATFNHADNRHCFRVVIALSRSVTAEEYDQLWEYVAARFEGLDASTRDAGRFWFWGAMPEGASYFAEGFAGFPLDVDGLLLRQVTAQKPDPTSTSRVATDTANVAEYLRLCQREWPAAKARSLCTSNEKAGEDQLYGLALRAGDLGIPEDQAENIAWEDYNRRALPPWPDAERSHFRHTFASAYAKRETLLGSEADAAAARAFVGAHESGIGASPRKGTYTHFVNVLARHEPWRGTIRFNSFTQVIELHHCPTAPRQIKALEDADEISIAMYFEQAFEVSPPLQKMHSAILAAAREHTYHPVHDYLNACAQRRSFANAIEAYTFLDRYIADALHLSTPLAISMVRKTMIAAVQRILDPGCQVDTVLVLVGRQGIGKSSFFRALFEGPTRAFFKDGLPPLDSKDAQLALAGSWCIELAELAATQKREVEEVKAFITRRVDNYRPPYARNSVQVPRQCIFVGSSNAYGFINDPTGGRRFWPIEAAAIDVEYALNHRDEAWAAAFLLALSHEPHWLTAEEEAEANRERIPFEEHDPWEDIVRVRAPLYPSIHLATFLEREVLLTREQATQARNTKRLAAILRKVGFTGAKTTGSRQEWSVPDELRVAAQATPTQQAPTSYAEQFAQAPMGDACDGTPSEHS